MNNDMDFKLIKADSDVNRVRLFRLEYGTVFDCKLGKLMYEDNKLHEVIFGGYEFENKVNPYWIKTGVKYTLEQFNELIKKEK